MREPVKLTGMVLRSTPVGEYDKRLMLLTRERGKLTTFARDTRRPNSILMGLSRPFTFGTFGLYEGRDVYNLHSTEITNYFDEISMDMEQYCYSQYFLEFADHYSRENLDGSVMLLLLYQSLQALSKPPIPDRLIQRIFGLRAMADNGEYTEHPPRKISGPASCTWGFVIASPLESLYTFQVTDPMFAEFRQRVEINKARYVDRDFHSLEVLKILINQGNSIENVLGNGYNLYICAKFKFWNQKGLFMKRAEIILAVVTAGVLLSGCAGRGGSTSAFSPKQGSVSVTRDGSISSALVKTYTNDHYDQSRLKASVEKSVTDLNTEQGRMAVVLNSCTLGNRKAIALFDCENTSDLCTFATATNDDWTQLEVMEFTTVGEGRLEGKLAGASWKKAEDSFNASTDSTTKKGEYYVVMLTGSATVQTEGKIQFYSGNVSLVDGYTAVVSGGQAYLVFK